MRLKSIAAAAACFLFQSTVAVFADDAWDVDYHYALLGAPLDHTTFFHQPSASSKASLLYTLSDKAVLGAVNPRDGSLVWRQFLGRQANTTSAHLRSGQGQDVVISAVDGDLTAWSSSDGRQVWSIDLGEGAVKDLEILDIVSGDGAEQVKDALVLSEAARPFLRRVDGATGAAKWTFTDESGDTPYQISASATEVFYITLHSAMLGGTKIRVTSLDPTNGHKTDQYTLGSDSEVSDVTDILSVGANSASPIIAWTDKAASVLKVNIIGTKSVSSFNIAQIQGQKIEQVSLHAPFSNPARPHFLVHYQTVAEHWADVFHVDLQAHTVSRAYSLPRLAGKGAFSTSSQDANVYFSRISETEVSVVSSASHGILARWPIKTFTGGNLAGTVAPVHAVSELSVKADTVSAARSAVLLSSGDWILIRDGTVSWHRPEVLASTVSAVWAYPSSELDTARELEKEAKYNVLQAYTHRVKRHIHDLHQLPGYIQNIPTMLLHQFGVGTDSAPKHNNFGYHKLIVCATESGRLIALDVGNKGSIVWNVRSTVAEPGISSLSTQLTALPDGSIQVENTSGGSSALLDATNGSQMSLLSTDMQGTNRDRLYEVKDNEIVGLPPSSASSAPTWRFKARSGDLISSVVARPADDPVASIGRVLGDRSVLYKYLNPNLLMITTLSTNRRSATLSLVDAISGAVLFTATHKNLDTTLPITATVAENWFAYSVGVDSIGSAAKGYQLVVGELYESSIPNDRGPLGENASSTFLDYQPHVLTQTYNIPEPISQMSVTQTQQGITSRQLLIVLPQSESIVGIPRAILDPRRPVGRDPTALEAAEGLVRYAPVLEFDPKWYLNHQRQLVGIQRITTSPATLESTSLVFAYGLDIFGTRVSPSFSFDVLGKDFNKLQMLATVFALAIGTFVVAPLVQRKQINARWQLQ